MVNYSGHNEKVKIQVTSPDQNNYTYPVTYLNQFVTYPLPGGNGTYKITVLESVDLTKCNLFYTTNRCLFRKRVSTISLF